MTNSFVTRQEEIDKESQTARPWIGTLVIPERLDKVDNLHFIYPFWS
jgi:hypothetical protein